jgi:hypothetical protein
MSDDTTMWVALAICVASMASCTAIESAYKHPETYPPQASVEVVCAKQWFPSEYCRALTAKIKKDPAP